MSHTLPDGTEADSAEPLIPWDEWNQQLAAHVRPADWRNPTPSGPYHLVVIGAGTAGLVTAAGAAGLGARVALIERTWMGGDCLNVGCVPSKALLRASRAAVALRDAQTWGSRLAGPLETDFGRVMSHVRQLRARLSPHDSATRFRDLGVDVYFGTAGFVDPRTIEVAGQRLEFRRAVIATGARAAIPRLNGRAGDGLTPPGLLTNENVFSLTERPRRLAVLGGGPIGVELAQAFARLGSRVDLFTSERGLLPREDRDAAELVRAALIQDGVRIDARAKDLTVEPCAGGWCLHLPARSSEPAKRLDVDHVLVATGRLPNVEGLGLEAAGVRYNEAGVVVNARLQTSNRRVYAAGDVCSSFKFTHAADFMARIVIQNALFRGRASVNQLQIPWCTYTSPEVAHVGIAEHDAELQGIAIDTYRLPWSAVDRAVLDGETAGFMKVHCRRGTDRIVGATVVAAHAGDLISPIALAMQYRIGLRKVARVIHPYPTQADAFRRLGDLYNRGRLTPRVKQIFKLWFRWMVK